LKVKDIINLMDYNDNKTSVAIENSKDEILYQDRSEWLLAIRYEDEGDFYTKRYGYLMDMEIKELYFNIIVNNECTELYIRVK
jgi:hypothetical protein